MKRITSDEAAEVYERTTGRSYRADVWFAWMVVVSVDLQQRVVRRAAAQLRARSGGRGVKALGPVPGWLSRGVEVFPALLREHPALAESPALQALAHVPPSALLAWIDPDAEAPDDLSAHVAPETVRGAFGALAAKPREDALARVFFESLRVVWAMEERGAPRPREVALLAGALGLEPFDGLDAKRKHWEDRMRRWSRTPPMIEPPVAPGVLGSLAPLCADHTPALMGRPMD